MRAIRLIPFLCLATSLAVAQSTSPLPSLSELSEGWHTLKPGGETLCAHGTEFEFWVRPGDRERLLVFLYGGGGCWDADGCQEGSTMYTAAIEHERHPSRLGGILDLDHPENPFKDYSMVAVPVCTGDAHLGANDTVYRFVTDDGQEGEFVIRHRGKTNVLSALDWIETNFAVPREIFVAGSSAGSVGAPFHASLLAQHYPEARVVGLSDDSASYGFEPTSGADLTRWGLPDVLREYPGWEAFEAAGGSEAVTVTAGLTTPNLRLYQVDHAYDSVQLMHIRRTGMEDPDVFRLLQRTREGIRAQLPGFRAYTLGGFAHTSLWTPYFYRYAEDGFWLRDWVAAIAAGEDVPDVTCSNCERATFLFDADDLTIVEQALEVLARQDAWNPQDAGGSCPANAERFSLRCALVEVGRRSGWALSQHPVALEVIFAAAAGEPAWRGPNSVIHFNNADGRTHEEVVALLDGVRARVVTALQDR